MSFYKTKALLLCCQEPKPGTHPEPEEYIEPNVIFFKVLYV